MIKVEEELRKEQSEMHRLLKAKQELIEIQKKRIEYLSNGNKLSSSTSNQQAASQTSATNSSTTLNNNNNGNHLQIGLSGSNGSNGSMSGSTASLVQTHPALTYNQHSYHPKLKPKTTTVQLKTPAVNHMMMMTSSMSNPNINNSIQDSAPSNLVPLMVAKLGKSFWNDQSCLIFKFLKIFII